MLQFFLATLLSVVFDVESLPVGDGLIRIKRYATIESGPGGWLVFNIGAWNVLFCVVWFYLGISILIYCTTRWYLSCCLSATKHDEKDKSDTEVLHSITINGMCSGSEHTQASSKSEKAIPTALETKDKVILVPQIRQKLFTCREMSRRTVGVATDSKRKFKPMKTAVSVRGQLMRAATNTAVGHSKRGGKKPSLHADTARSTRSGTTSGSSNVSTPSSSSSSSSSSPASESYSISQLSYGHSKRSSRSGRSERNEIITLNVPLKAFSTRDNTLHCCCSNNDTKLHFDPPTQNPILSSLDPGIGAFQTFCWTHDDMGAMCRILTEVTPLDLKYNTTGNTDTMIDQSRETALTFVERHQTELGIIYPDPTKYKIVNQFLPSSLPKEGFSGGASIATAVVSYLKKKPVKKGVGVIGGICLNGELEYVGKLGTKMKVAKREGFTKLIIPKVMLDDYNRLYKEEKEGIEVVFVNNFLQAVDLLFEEDNKSTKEEGEEQGSKTKQDIFNNNNHCQLPNEPVNNNEATSEGILQAQADPICNVPAQVGL
uniref:Lon proteolytic domain-containing protein n=1 Tax=Meloidogyne enterolobii TaxID=390850 RepID=A0A6V7VGK6_MELEN|nr:unnamed protein product [Meloidogyne enterolobii]